MGKPKHTKILCVVCKKYITVHDEKEFRNLGHFIDQKEGKHLLAPDVGKSTRRHEAAVRRDQAHQIALLVSKKASVKEEETV